MEETQLTDSGRRVAAGQFAAFARSGVSILLVVSLSGCAMFRENHYMASEMPPQLAALPVSNPQLLNFAELTGSPSDSQMIGKLDVLEVSTLPSLNSREAFKYGVRVGEDGMARIPEVGPVHLQGQTLAEAEATITQVSIERGLYRAPHVTVTMKERKVNKILVSGAVRKPGWYEIPAAECNLISAIFYAGNLAADAGTNVDIRNVVTRDELLNEAIASTQVDGVAQAGYAQKGTPRQASVDLISAVKDGRDGYFIADGGSVHIERRSPDAIYVDGLVKKSGRQIFPLDDEEFRLLEAIALAGGPSSQVADKVFVVRAVPVSGQPAVIQASIRKAKYDEAHNLLLAPGDFVSIEHTPATVIMEVLQMVRVGASLNPFLP